MPSADCTKALHYKKKILGKVEPTEEGKEGEDEKRGRGRKWQENKGEGREKGRGGGRTVSYTHLTLPTIVEWCRSRWSPYH